ncbi:MAG: sodium:calcium antiporter [Halobacteriaceae archaeon]
MALDLTGLPAHWLVALLLGGTVLVWQGSEVLEASSETLAVHYELPPVVQGAVVAAVGSSFPELSTTVISTLLHGEFSLGVGAIVGSAVFNVLVIPGLSGLFTAERLESSRDVAYKEALFYMLSVAALFAVFSMSVVYYRQEAVGPLVGTVTRPFAASLVVLYGLYVFIQWQDTQDHTPTRSLEAGVSVARQWLLLAASLLVILVGVEAMVQAVLGFGELFGTPSFLWGVTVIAAGTSLPDTLVSVRAARKGSGVTSLANVLGSNVFDLLVAIPAGVLIAGSASVNFAVAGPMLAFLVFATVVLFAFLRTDLSVTTPEALVLVGVYVVFVGWVTLETLGLVRGVIPSV